MTPGFAEALAAKVAEIYGRIEQRILSLMSEHMKKGIETSDWVQTQLTQATQFRKAAQKVVQHEHALVVRETRKAVTTAYDWGSRSAAKELTESLGNAAREGVGLASQPVKVVALAQQELGKREIEAVRKVHFPILSQVDDVYSQVIREVMASALTGAETRKVVAQRALDEFAKRGITVFTRGGKTWQISSYVEMALRTALMNASLQGHADQIIAQGKDLIVISDHPQECALCRPWEGTILSLTGSTTVGTHTDKGNTFYVKGTLDEARQAGLFHPNCRHSFTAFVPGITRSFGETADPEGDKARQRLRELERQVRKWRRVEAVALDPAAQKDARRRVADYQAAIRSHVASTTARRQPDREKITGVFR